MARDDNPWNGPWTGGDHGSAPPPAAAAPGEDDQRNPWLGGDGEEPRRRSAAIDHILRPGPGGPIRQLRPPRRWLGWALTAALAAWIGGTAIHALGESDRALVTTFGRYDATIGPGMHLTLPWPLQAVKVRQTGREIVSAFPEKDGETLMPTGDGELIDLAFQLRWQIGDLRAFTYGFADGDATLRQLAEAEMRAAVAEVPFEALRTGQSQGELQQRVAGRLQRLLDAAHAGVRIAGVEIVSAKPPGKLTGTFQKIGTATEEARKNHERAMAWAQQSIENAETEAASFERIYTQYKLAPAVTRQHMYYDTVERVLRNNPVVLGGSATPASPPPGPDQPAAPGGQ